MASGRTISASLLTGLDGRVIRLCESISTTISAAVPDAARRSDFTRQYGKIHTSRDGGVGLGAGKLQRDALCTRGRTSKAPFSNRNLRWHPLVVAQEKPLFAKEIEGIEIEGERYTKTLVFVVKDQNDKEQRFPAEKAHQLPERFVVLPKDWQGHEDELKAWGDVLLPKDWHNHTGDREPWGDNLVMTKHNLWTKNSCAISAAEACDWWDAVETYAVLGIAIAVDFYEADFDKLHGKVVSLLQGQTVDKSVSLPTSAFPAAGDDILQCSLCRRRVSAKLEDFRKAERGETWQPAWRTSKRNEGNDSSIQLMHINPLVEREIRHRADNVRYGHRWCNVAMTDHSLDEILDLMESVVQAHNREGKW